MGSMFSFEPIKPGRVLSPEGSYYHRTKVACYLADTACLVCFAIILLVRVQVASCEIERGSIVDLTATGRAEMLFMPDTDIV
jgi:hypothetical protein